jgi:hypothetical protein
MDTIVVTAAMPITTPMVDSTARILFFNNALRAMRMVSKNDIYFFFRPLTNLSPSFNSPDSISV